MGKFIKEFKEFAVKGNVMDMAIGVIIGGAFGKIVSSLVNDVIMPLISKAVGGVSFTDMFINLTNDEKFATLKAAQEAGVSVFAWAAADKQGRGQQKGSDEKQMSFHGM